MRAAVNLSRLHVHRDLKLLLYEPNAGQEVDSEVIVDPLELLARALIHIPEPRRHQVNFHGVYANRVRAIYRRQDPALPGAGGEANAETSKRTLSKRWRELIYRIYEVELLDCPRCGARMKILAFIIPQSHPTNPRPPRHRALPRATPESSPAFSQPRPFRSTRRLCLHAVVQASVTPISGLLVDAPTVSADGKPSQASCASWTSAPFSASPRI